MKINKFYVVQMNTCNEPIFKYLKLNGLSLGETTYAVVLVFDCMYVPETVHAVSANFIKLTCRTNVNWN